MCILLNDTTQSSSYVVLNRTSSSLWRLLAESCGGYCEDAVMFVSYWEWKEKPVIGFWAQGLHCVCLRISLMGSVSLLHTKKLLLILLKGNSFREKDSVRIITTAEFFPLWKCLSATITSVWFPASQFWPIKTRSHGVVHIPLSLSIHLKHRDDEGWRLGVWCFVMEGRGGPCFGLGSWPAFRDLVICVPTMCAP